MLVKVQDRGSARHDYFCWVFLQELLVAVFQVLADIQFQELGDKNQPGDVLVAYVFQKVQVLQNLKIFIN